MINNLYQNTRKEGGAAPLIILKIIFKLLLKKLKLIILKKPLGLIHPLSMTFFTISFPILLILLTLKNRKIKEFVKNFLNIDIQERKSYFNRDSLKELMLVYGSYFIICQIFFILLINPSSKRRIKRGKLTTLGISDIPKVLFDTISLIIVPRMVYNFIDKNISFNLDENKKLSSQILYYTAILGIIGLNNLWNLTNFIITFILTFIFIIILENNKFTRKLFYKFFGFQFPEKKDIIDYIKVSGFLTIFIYILVSCYSKYVPFYDEFFGSEMHFLEVVIKIFFCVFLPLKFKNLAKGTNYESEMFLLGNLLSIFIPILFQDVIDKFYDGVDFVNEGIDMASEELNNLDMNLSNFEEYGEEEYGDY